MKVETGVKVDLTKWISFNNNLHLTQAMARPWKGNQQLSASQADLTHLRGCKLMATSLSFPQPATSSKRVLSTVNQLARSGLITLTIWSREILQTCNPSLSVRLVISLKWLTTLLQFNQNSLKKLRESLAEVAPLIIIQILDPCLLNNLVPNLTLSKLLTMTRRSFLTRWPKRRSTYALWLTTNRNCLLRT